MKIFNKILPVMLIVPSILMVTSCNEPEQKEQPNFETDSWENVIAHADSLETLLDYYKPANNTFVGLTREITLTTPDFTKPTSVQNATTHQIVHKVRVIGENEDYGDVTNKDKKAALTFQFANAIS